MILDRPNFMDSPYFVNERFNWHLKPGAPQEIVDEFNEYMSIVKKDTSTQKSWNSYTTENIGERLERGNGMGILNLNKSQIINYNELTKSFKEEQHKRDAKGRFSKMEGGKGNDGKESGKQDSGSNGSEIKGKAEGAGANGRTDSGTSGSISRLSQEHYPARADHEYSYHRIGGGNAHEVFGSAIADAKEGNPYGAFVDAYDPDDYKNVKTILSEGGEAGIGVKPSGDIVSVFHNKDIKKPGKGKVVPHLLELALQNGGDRLDCLNVNGGLASMYAQMGFEPVARMKFDREYAPEGWNYERDGEPDVVFMAHNGDSVEDVRKKAGSYPDPSMEDVPYIDDYDLGAEYQEAYHEKRKDPVAKSFQDFHSLMKGW